MRGVERESSRPQETGGERQNNAAGKARPPARRVEILMDTCN